MDEKLADCQLMAALLGSLVFLAVVLGLMTFAIHDKAAAILFVGLLGVGAFATVAPLQLRVLQQAGSGQTLASSLNIGAFNLGNAIGAWLGGIILERGPSLTAIPWIASLVAVSAVLVALVSRALESKPVESVPGCEE